MTLTIIFFFHFFHSQNIQSIVDKFASITLGETTHPWSGSLSSALKCIAPNLLLIDQIYQRKLEFFVNNPSSFHYHSPPSQLARFSESLFIDLFPPPLPFLTPLIRVELSELKHCLCVSSQTYSVYKPVSYQLFYLQAT